MNSEHYNNPYSDSNQLIPCQFCGHPFKHIEGRIPACDPCREKFIRYPIPRKVKALLFISLCIVIALMVYRLPASLTAGVCYEKAVRAMDEKRFLDAEMLLENAYALIPNSSLIAGNLAICCHMNVHQVRELNLYDEMYQKEMVFKDSVLFEKLNTYNNMFISIFNVPDEYAENYAQIEAMDDHERLMKLEELSVKYPECMLIKMRLADVLFDQQQFDRTEVLVAEALANTPGYIPFEVFQAAVYREKGQFQAAEEKLMGLLEQNIQSSYVLCCLSRLELKRNNDDKAMEYAQAAYDLEPEDLGVMIDYALSLHFNHMEQELSKTLEKIANHPEAESYTKDIQWLKDIIDGTTNWR